MVNSLKAFLASMKAVAWSFVGLRSSSGLRQDLTKTHPVHLIVAGLISVLVMVLGLVSIVHFVLN